MSSKKGHSTLLLYGFSKKVLVILQKLGEGLIQARIAEMSPMTKMGVNYWVKKFLREKIIRVKSEGWQKQYELTAKGQAILTRSEMPSIPCQMEDYPMKFRLVADYGGLDWKKLGEPKNWEKLGVKVGRVRVEKNLGKQPTIIIHTGQIVGFHPDHCMLEAGSIIADVKAILKSHGVLVDPVGLPLRKTMFKFYTEEAEILHKQFGNITTEEGVIDDSPPDRIPHEEYPRQTAINKLGEANRIARIEGKINQLFELQEKMVEGMEILSTNMVTLTETLSKAINPEPQQPKKVKDEKGSPFYVS